MLAPFRQRFVTAFLAATYLVVGATGESLYYLLESPPEERWAEGQPDDSYFHDHGHGHWHHHAAHPQEANRKGGSKGLGFRADGTTGHDHTCLLIALAEAIELSLRVDLPTLAAPETRTLAARGSDSGVASSGTACLGPRGPPGNGQA